MLLLLLGFFHRFNLEIRVHKHRSTLLAIAHTHTDGRTDAVLLKATHLTNTTNTHLSRNACSNTERCSLCVYVLVLLEATCSYCCCRLNLFCFLFCFVVVCCCVGLCGFFFFWLFLLFVLLFFVGGGGLCLFWGVLVFFVLKLYVVVGFRCVYIYILNVC